MNLIVSALMATSLALIFAPTTAIILVMSASAYIFRVSLVDKGEYISFMEKRESAAPSKDLLWKKEVFVRLCILNIILWLVSAYLILLF